MDKARTVQDQRKETIMTPTRWGIRLECWWDGKMVYTTRCDNVQQAEEKAEYDAQFAVKEMP